MSVLRLIVISLFLYFLLQCGPKNPKAHAHIHHNELVVHLSTYWFDSNGSEKPINNNKMTVSFPKKLGIRSQTLTPIKSVNRAVTPYQNKYELVLNEQWTVEILETVNITIEGYAPRELKLTKAVSLPAPVKQTTRHYGGGAQNCVKDDPQLVKPSGLGFLNLFRSTAYAAGVMYNCTHIFRPQYQMKIVFQKG